MGGKSNKPPEPSPYEVQAGEIAKQMWGYAEPLLQTMAPQMQSALAGDFDPRSSPMYSPMFQNLRSGISQGYSGALDDILANTAGGQGQDKLIADMFTQRGRDLSFGQNQLFSDLYGQQLGQAQSFATGVPSQSAGQFTNLGQIQASNWQASEQANAARKGSQMGMFGDLGMALGYGFGG